MAIIIKDKNKGISEILAELNDIPETDTVLELIMPDLSKSDDSCQQLVDIFSAIPGHITSLKINTDIFANQTSMNLTIIINAIPPGILEVPEGSSHYFQNLARTVNKITRESIGFRRLVSDNSPFSYAADVMNGIFGGGIIGGTIALMIIIVAMVITTAMSITAVIIASSFFLPFVGIVFAACVTVGLVLGGVASSYAFKSESAVRQGILSKLLGKFKYTNRSPEESGDLQEIFKQQFKLDEYPGQLLMRIFTNGVPNDENMKLAQEIGKVDRRFAMGMVCHLIMMALGNNTSDSTRIISNLEKFVALLPAHHRSEVVAMAFKELPVFEVDKAIKTYPLAMKETLLKILSLLDKDTMEKILLVPEEKGAEGGLDVTDKARGTCLALQTRLHDKETLNDEEKSQLLSDLVDNVSSQNTAAEQAEQKRRMGFFEVKAAVGSKSSEGSMHISPSRDRKGAVR